MQFQAMKAQRQFLKAFSGMLPVSSTNNCYSKVRDVAVAAD